MHTLKHWLVAVPSLRNDDAIVIIIIIIINVCVCGRASEASGRLSLLAGTTSKASLRHDLDATDDDDDDGTFRSLLLMLHNNDATDRHRFDCAFDIQRPRPCLSECVCVCVLLMCLSV